MFLPEQFATRRRGNWCALVVLVAVCSLTVSLATRYTLPVDSSASSIRTVASHAATYQTQRLVKATNWVAPALCSAVFQPTTSYPRIADVAPLIPTGSLLKLYTLGPLHRLNPSFS